MANEVVHRVLSPNVHVEVRQDDQGAMRIMSMTVGVQATVRITLPDNVLEDSEGGVRQLLELAATISGARMSDVFSRESALWIKNNQADLDRTEGS